MSEGQSTPDNPPNHGWELPDYLQQILANSYSTFARDEKHDEFYYQNLGEPSLVVRILYVLHISESHTPETGVKLATIRSKIGKLYGTSIDDTQLQKPIYRLNERTVIGKTKDGNENVVWLVNPYAGRDPVSATGLPVSVTTRQQTVKQKTVSKADSSSTVANAASESKSSNVEQALSETGGLNDGARNKKKQARAEANPLQTVGTSHAISEAVESLHGQHSTGTSKDDDSDTGYLHDDAPSEGPDNPIDVVGQTVLPILQIRANGEALRDGVTVSGKNEYFEGAFDAGLLFVFVLVSGILGAIYAPIAGLALVLFAGFWLSVSLVATGCGAAKEWTAVPVP
ncbi:hypothetical protein [Natrialba sp. SSL1]|uniref:hypothetical protein n=1 Tax=Natrialba sp. SSL1 TaxID=1869245 RepID=UPI0008F95299|nr:hypothetical protein [Natrialba sp. SSL1]OIB58843.1 hypothetical protein BBD46_06465 [Natrialba sp. SSL1]